MNELLFIVLLVVLAASAAGLAGAFFGTDRWLGRVVVIDSLSLVTACAVCVLAAIRGNDHLLDAAILVSMVAVVGTTAVVHFMPLPTATPEQTTARSAKREGTP